LFAALKERSIGAEVIDERIRYREWGIVWKTARIQNSFSSSEEVSWDEDKDTWLFKYRILGFLIETCRGVIAVYYLDRKKSLIPWETTTKIFK
jgi:hypothetical protein